MNNKKREILDNMLIFGIVFVTVFCFTNIIGGRYIDNVTKSTCNLLNEVYVRGDKPGTSYCEKR